MVCVCVCPMHAIPSAETRESLSHSPKDFFLFSSEPYFCVCMRHRRRRRPFSRAELPWAARHFCLNVGYTRKWLY